jgi:hypothetical protein
VTYTQNHKAVGEMLCAPFMVAAMRKRAERGKEFAESIAPVDETGPHPGQYKAAFDVEAGVRQPKTRRAFGRLVNTAEAAFYVEFGTVHNDAHHVLRKTLEVMGE